MIRRGSGTVSHNGSRRFWDLVIRNAGRKIICASTQSHPRHSVLRSNHDAMARGDDPLRAKSRPCPALSSFANHDAMAGGTAISSVAKCRPHPSLTSFAKKRRDGAVASNRSQEKPRPHPGLTSFAHGQSLGRIPVRRRLQNHIASLSRAAAFLRGNAPASSQPRPTA